MESEDGDEGREETELQLLILSISPYLRLYRVNLQSNLHYLIAKPFSW